jgi:hypothetical protein
VDFSLWTRRQFLGIPLDAARPTAAAMDRAARAARFSPDERARLRCHALGIPLHDDSDEHALIRWRPGDAERLCFARELYRRGRLTDA